MQTSLLRADDSYQFTLALTTGENGCVAVITGMPAKNLNVSPSSTKCGQFSNQSEASTFWQDGEPP
jgi:hypothetical protein